MKAEHETETLPEILDGDGLPPTDPELGTCPYCQGPLFESQIDDSVRGLHFWCAVEAFDYEPRHRDGCPCPDCGNDRGY